MILVLFLLCSGLSHFTFGSTRLRVFNITGKKQKWDEALSECKERNESLVTLYDEEDANFMYNTISENVWLGLRKGRNITWSDGVPVTFNDSYVTGTNLSQICVAIDNKNWTSFNCSERKPFMCNKDGKYTLFEDKKNWCQALQYCRKSVLADLVSISNKSQNEEVIRKGNGASFWIGLMYDEWEWEDKSCSLYRKWGRTNIEQNCTIANLRNSGLLNTYKCQTQKANTFCSKGKMRIRVIEHRLTWEEAFDYCKANHTGMLQIEDQNDQNTVEQWMAYTNVTVTGPFWIGLRQSHVFGFWIWSDRTITYSNWKNGIEPKLPMSNHCGAINETKWSDENCWLKLPFLCEEEIVFMN